MARRTPGVGVYGKIRIPTIGHKAAIDAAKQIASRNGAKLHIAVSGTSYPLTTSQKEAAARSLFQHPVETNHKNVVDFLSHMSSIHDEFVLVCGSDRVHEYRTLLTRYNGNRDRTGKVPFSFTKWEVHEVAGRRTNSMKSPLRMSPDELVRSVSATKIEQLAREGKYDEFRAYYPSMSDRETKRFYSQIRRGLSLHEELENAETSRQGRGWGNSFHDHELRGNKDVDRVGTESSRLVAEAKDRKRGEGIREGRNASTINLPILDLIRTVNAIDLKEETKKWEMDDLIDKFSDFVCSKLGISSKPIIKRQTDNDKSFGGYHPGEKTIYLVTKNRHPMDAFRTLAHEIVHYKQDLDGRIKDVAREGATGSPIEDEANYMAGRILRWWAKTNPGHFALGSLTENVAIFVVGGPCSGKDQFIRQLKEETEFVEQDIHSLLKNGEAASSVIVNASANNLDAIREARELLNSNGYHTSMLFISTTDEISKLRNEQRKEKGQRVIAENVRLSKYTEAQKNKTEFARLFGEDMKEVSNNTKFGIDLKPRIKPDKKRKKPTEINDPNPTIDATGVGPTFGGYSKVQKPFGLAESIVKWIENPKTQERFAKKYGDLAEKRLLETAKKLNENIQDKQVVARPKTISQIRESIDKGLLDRSGTVPGPPVSVSDPLPEDGKIYKRKAKKPRINK